MTLRRHFFTGLFVIVPAWGADLILSAARIARWGAGAVSEGARD